MRLHPIPAGDPIAVRAALPAALSGRRPLALGFEPAPDESAPDGTAVVIATSGSSGVPKRVVLSADALRASASATAARVGTGSWLLALPAGYVAGLQVLVRSQLAGTEPVLLHERFTADAFARATSSLRASVGGGQPLLTSLVPAQLTTILEACDDADVLAAARAYRAILVGGQALPVPLRERAAELGIRLVRTYGASETSGGCVYDGAPLDGARVRVVAGELQIAGPMLADGYLGDDALAARAFVHDDGARWYRTGDLGELDGGIVRVHGRADNVIVSGGINVSLDRVEAVVRSIRGMDGAVVTGVDDARWGQASVVVVARGGQGAGDGAGDETALLALVRDAVAERIGKPARPSRVLLMDELPMLASGKPDRTRIRAIAASR